MINDEISRLQLKLNLAEQRMLLGESNVPLVEARLRLQAKYESINCPNRLHSIGTQKTYQN